MTKNEIAAGTTVHIADSRKGYQGAVKVLAVTPHDVLPHIVTIETYGRFQLTVSTADLYATEKEARRRGR